MRLCPACGQLHEWTDWQMSYKLPDQWTLMSNIRWYECPEYGGIFGDWPVFNQTQLDKYYSEHYGYGLDTPANRERLHSLAEEISMMEEIPHGELIADFGGGDGYLVNCLRDLGLNAVTWNIGEESPPHDSARLVIASHVFEHIYDMESVMMRFANVLKANGYVLVELPDALRYYHQTMPPILDYTPRHINHFTPHCLNSMMFEWGYETLRCEWLTGINHATYYRALYWNARPSLYRKVHTTIEQNMAERVAKLRAIGKPVIVWGLADMAWHSLALAPWLQIAGFVDMDPAYRGQTIDGIPVLDHVETDDPIVIMVSNPERGQDIVDTIRGCGYPNEVIVV